MHKMASVRVRKNRAPVIILVSLAALLTAGLAAHYVGSAGKETRDNTRASHSSASVSQAQHVPPPGGPPAGAGATWSPDIDPLTQGRETSRSQAVSQAGYPVYRPDVALASDGSVSHAWMATQSPGNGMLPNHLQTTVAFEYSSGIVVTYLPWQYGPNAPPLSQMQIAIHYRAIASQAPAGAMTVDTIQGVPALVISQNVGGQGNPGSIEMELGTSNADAITVTVFGRYSTGDLESVAASIGSQWQGRSSG